MGFGSQALILLRKACKLTFAILFIPFSIYSQQFTDLENYILVKRLSSDDGLSQGNVTAILRDSYGYTWIGTDNGLSRFDGDEIRDFKYNFGDSSSISDNNILCLFEDSQQRLWVGTNRGGLNLFDRHSETFISFGQDSHHPFNRFSVFDILEDKDQNLWIATQNGLYRSNTSPLSFTLIQETVENMDGRITSILEDDSHNIWMGTLYGLSVMNKKDYSIKTYYSDSKKANTLTSNRINTIFLDKHKNLWIGTGNGLSILNTQDHSIFNFNTDPNDLKSIDSKIIYTINEDAKGRIWLGTKGAGISIYENDSLNHFSLASVSSSLARLNTPVQAIYFDPDGLVWVGTYGDGVKVWGRKTKDFDYIRIKGTPLSDVLCMVEDHGNLIWIGTGKGLLTYEPKTNSIQPFDKNRYTNTPLNSSVIKSLLIDKSNNVFVGTYSHGLFHIDNQTKKITTYSNDINKPGSIPSNDVWSLCQDSKDRIWVGTLAGGINEFNYARKSFTRYAVMDGDKVSQRSNSISKIYEDSKGNIWLGTIGQGISKYDERMKVFRVCSSPENISSKINSNEVIDIFESERGTLYVTTKEEGLFYYDSKTEKFIPEHSDNLQRAILSVLDDDQGNLWMGTFYGLCKYNPKNKSVIYYTTTDGLQGNEFRAGSKLKSSSGKFYFGGTNGITAFRPENIKIDSITPSVILTDFYTLHEKLSNENSITKGHIRLQDSLTLQADQNTFTIQFRTQNYQFPKKNQFAYKLENFDSEWNMIGRKRSATYTNLPPGKYIFKVKASNNEGIWSTTTTDIFIFIKPPYWETWWFRILAILLSVGAVLSLFKYRVYQLKQDNLVLEGKVRERTGELSGLVTELQRKQNELSITLDKMNAQKTQIEQINLELKTTHEELKTINDELDQKVFERTLKLQKANHELDRFVYSASHDLIAPLKSLLGLIQITRIEKRADQIDSHLDKMELTVTKLEHVIQSLTQLSRNMGHQVKKEALSFNEIVDEVLGDINHLPGFNNVKIIKNFNNQDTITSDYFRTKIILTNLLSNAIKYKLEKNDSTVWINYSMKDNKTFIEIKDNGIGIEKSKCTKIFDMFYRGTTQSNGSGLGLYIVKETVEKLEGEIKVESNPGQITTFSIYLPA